jgi:hypothetical protein
MDTPNETPPVPPARGQRLEWDALPPHVVRTIDLALGDPIVTTTTIHGGFSPGIACIARTFGGQEFFVKAACSVPNEHAPAFHRNEIRIASRFGPDVPAPKLIWSFDEGAPGWVVLVFEVVHGHNPELPWRSRDVDLVVATLNRLAASLTPSPIPAEIAGDLPSWRPFRESAWALLAANPPETLDPWARRHLGALVALEGRTADVVAGDTLVHLDIRGDNLLLTDDGVVVVDWPHARVGAAWVDVVFFAPSLAMQGGPDPEDLIARVDVARNADPDAITAVIANTAGFFTFNGSLPPLEGLPGLREFQEGQGAVARRWLAHRTGWT